MILSRLKLPTIDQFKMSDDGWGDDDAGWTDGDQVAAPAPDAGGDADPGDEEEEKPRGGGDGECRNCREVSPSMVSVMIRISRIIL